MLAMYNQVHTLQRGSTFPLSLLQHIAAGMGGAPFSYLPPPLFFFFYFFFFAGLLGVLCLSACTSSLPPPPPCALSTHGLPCSVCVSGVGAAFVVLSAVSWGEDKHVWSGD